MTVIVEWFGETGKPTGSVMLYDVKPTELATEVRAFVGRQFQTVGNPHAVAVVSVLNCEADEMIRTPPAIQPSLRFVVTNMTQGNWGNGSAF